MTDTNKQLPLFASTDAAAGQEDFPTNYTAILQRLENIKPLKYAGTRNFTDGHVTRLSPYVSRGVISLLQIKNHVLKTHKPYQVVKFLQELAWREYWQRVWLSLGDKLFTDIKQPQPDVLHHGMVAAIEEAGTGIHAIDQHINDLYKTGYLHNHVRMYVAAITCNIAKAHWLQPSQWLYYHLLDGDLASNSLSWQWVAGAFSSKKYYCNQENINRYTGSNQTGTFLDAPYQTITAMPVPAALQGQSNFTAVTTLPVTSAPVLDTSLPIYIYNSYNLDIAWHAEENANRILLLEPSHFKAHAVSDKVIDFIIALAANISGIQIFTAEFNELKAIAGDSAIIFKSHPAFTHYRGHAEKYDEMFPEVSGYFPSFFSYWKKCERYLKS